MRTGKVRLYIPPKRYGFITADDGKGDIYFHMNDVKPRRCWMGAGMNVEFEDEVSEEGSRRSTRVSVVEGTNLMDGGQKQVRTGN